LKINLTIKQMIMKKCTYVLLALQLFLFGCKKDEVKPVPESTFHLRFTKAKIETSPDAGTIAGVAIEANSNWQLSLPTAGTEWLELDKVSGNGNDSLKIRVIQKNTTGAKRSVVITGSLVNGKVSPVQLTVEQDGESESTGISVAWKKILGGNGNEYPYAIINSADGGHVIAGRTSSSNDGDVSASKGGVDFWIVKLNNTGAIAWQKTMGGNGNEIATGIVATPDGGYAISGYTNSDNNGDVAASNGGSDYWIVKINGTGDILWKKVLGGSKDDLANSITVTSEGVIVVAGQTLSSNTGDVATNHGNDDCWIVALSNTDGAVKWKKIIGGNFSEKGKSVISSGDGGVIVGGETNSSNNGDVPSSHGNIDFLLTKLDKDGNIVWNNCAGGLHGEELSSLAAGPNESFFAAGTTKSNSTGDVGASKGSEDYWIVKFNATTGALIWQKVLGGNASDYGRGIAVNSLGQIIAAGYTTSNNNGDVELNQGAADFWLIRLNEEGGIVWKKLLGGNNDDMLYSVSAANDGSYAVAGYTYSNNSGDVGANHGNGDFWVVKLGE
jgi:hypothetical protein